MHAADGTRFTPELNCAVVTPLDAHGEIDTDRLLAHVEWLTGRGVSRIALFGTTGEGPSFTLAERHDTLDALIGEGVDPGRLIVTTGCAAPREASLLARHAAAHGCSACLVMPPFFFPAPTDDGLFAALGPVMDALADGPTRAILYHIPAMTGVPVTSALVARVAKAYPGALEGIKDSAGDRGETLARLEAFPELRVFVGNEPDLPAALEAGGAGTISGLVNCAPRLVAALLAGDAAAPARIAALQRAVVEAGVVPAIKALVAAVHGAPEWTRVRAPLAPLGESALGRLADDARELLDGARGAA